MSAPVEPFSLLAAGPSSTISDREYRLFQALVEREAGIHLNQSKRSLLVGRLARRPRALGLATFGEYYEHVVSGGDHGELVQMLDCVSTNETHFFRAGPLPLP